MFLTKVNTNLFFSATNRNKALQLNLTNNIHRKVRKMNAMTFSKRGAVLMEYITNRDKKKNWHFNIVSDKPKARVLEKVHKPRRRASVLNSVLIKNITDVLSTADVAPDILKYGLEITGVRITPCSKILNVFWQLPSSQFNAHEDVKKLLTIASPKIRAELISRNVLGRVPYIFFLRDGTNEKIAAFEEAMAKVDLGPEPDIPVVVDDSFTKNIMAFTSARGCRVKNDHNTLNNIEDYIPSETTCNKEELPAIPQKPADMKCDVFGLDHEQMMQKIMALKKKNKGPPSKTALITLENLKDGDLFDKIPGTRFGIETTSSRDEALKKFNIERKMMKQKIKEDSTNLANNCNDRCEIDDDDDIELNSYDEDFIDDEIAEK